MEKKLILSVLVVLCGVGVILFFFTKIIYLGNILQE